MIARRLKSNQRWQPVSWMSSSLPSGAWSRGPSIQDLKWSRLSRITFKDPPLAGLRYSHPPIHPLHLLHVGSMKKYIHNRKKIKFSADFPRLIHTVEIHPWHVYPVTLHLGCIHWLALNVERFPHTSYSCSLLSFYTCSLATCSSCPSPTANKRCF